MAADSTEREGVAREDSEADWRERQQEPVSCFNTTIQLLTVFTRELPKILVGPAFCSCGFFLLPLFSKQIPRQSATGH